jgi:hypothetical protein
LRKLSGACPVDRRSFAAQSRAVRLASRDIGRY